MSRLKIIVCFAALGFAGCGGPPPKLDTTTDGSTAASLKLITEGMNDAEKKQFQSDCDIALVPGQYESTTSAKGSGPKDKFKSLNGLTADEIRARAATLRIKLSQ